MKIKTYRNYNPDARRKAKPQEIVRQVLRKMDNTLVYLHKLKPEIVPKYISAFEQRLQDEIGSSDDRSDTFEIPPDLQQDLGPLNAYLAIQVLIVQVICKHLPLPIAEFPTTDELEVLLLDEMRATFLVPYLRVKAFTDVLGKEAGIQLWKDLVAQATDDVMDEIEERPPIKEYAEHLIKGFASGEGADFTAVVFDDYRFLLKFDRCVVHEAFTYLNDPEIVYLSYCWTGDIEDARTTKSRRRRRSQTLHLGEFCDEFFWDNDIYPDAEQPALAFMRKLGQNDISARERIVQE